MLFRVFLALMICALALLFSGFVLQKLALGDLAEFIDTFAADIMLAGFALLLLVAIGYALRCIYGDVLQFFSGKEAACRKVLFTQSRRRELEQRRFSELMQLNYFNALKRARILRSNDRKHVRPLARAIYRQLDAARANMPHEVYEGLKQAVSVYCRRLDGDGLMALQKQISSYE